MFQIQAPILIVPTADAKLAVGVHLHAAGLAAYREIALAAKGLEIAHLQFVFRRVDSCRVLARPARWHRRNRDRARRPAFAEKRLHRRPDAAGRNRLSGAERRRAVLKILARKEILA